MTKPLATDWKGEVLKCGYCFPREQHKHGEIKREWSPEWMQFIPVCRKHAIADGMMAKQDADTLPAVALPAGADTKGAVLSRLETNNA